MIVNNSNSSHAVIYTRTATYIQGSSISGGIGQHGICAEKAQELGLTVIACVSDIGASGATGTPTFLLCSAIMLLASYGGGVILCTEPSRISRDASTLEAVLAYTASIGIRIIACSVSDLPIDPTFAIASVRFCGSGE